jgi:hypothetical protein
MHALFLTVDIEPGRVEEAREQLGSTVVPMAKRFPGFVRGIWWSSPDGLTGHAVHVFATEAAADEMALLVETEGPVAGDPVKVRRVELGPVLAEA